jgi:hypothetical protein
LAFGLGYPGPKKNRNNQPTNPKNNHENKKSPIDWCGNSCNKLNTKAGTKSASSSERRAEQQQQQRQ